LPASASTPPAASPPPDDRLSIVRASDAVAGGTAELWAVRAGRVPYAAAREAQKALETARYAGEIGDVLLLLEHPPVYTRGRRSTTDELPMGEDWYRAQGIEVCETDRGGRVTYHGPGQLVAYPIVSLKPYGDDVHEYIRRMELAMIAALGDFGVEAQVIAGLTGVWTTGTGPLPAGAEGPQGTVVGAVASAAVASAAELEPARKIGAIGIHVNRGITTHGLAINVNNDLQPFGWIVPCGIDSCQMTSLARELGAEQHLDRFATALTKRFGEAFERTPREVAVEELARLVAGAAALETAVTASVP
jgi:lipoyl(octanoyl) transferase